MDVHSMVENVFYARSRRSLASNLLELLGDALEIGSDLCYSNIVEQYTLPS